MNPELFPALPQDLSALTPDELSALRDEFKAAARAIRDHTADLGDLSAEQVVEQFTNGVVSLRAIEAEITGRDEAEETFTQTISEIAADVNLDDEPETLAAEEPETAASEDDEDDGDDEPVPTEKTEATESVEKVEKTETVEKENVTASAETRPMRLPAVPKQHQPMIADEKLAAFVASAGIPNVREGMPLARLSLAAALISKRHQMTSTPRGVKEDVVVASVDYGQFWPEDRVLTNDRMADQQKIDSVIGPAATGVNPETGEEALIASGGICNPPTNLYDIISYGTAARPVRDSLPGFNAIRGGVNLAPGVTISDVDSTATGIVTAAEDAAGGTTGAKSCWHVDCPPFQETTIQAIYQCLEFGNFTARAWPELVDTWVRETRAAHARLAETALLDGITAASTAVTRAAQYNATSTIIAGLMQAAAGYRSRHRTDPNLRLRALLPEWLPDLLLNDLSNQQFGRFDYTREGITTLLRRFAIEPVFYLDGATGAGQVFGAQAPGTLTPFPTSVVGYLFPEGTFIYLDSGSIDFGLVRDSTLNQSNDYQLFMEDFENVAFAGVESLKITWTVCPTGSLAAPTTAITC